MLKHWIFTMGVVFALATFGVGLSAFAREAAFEVFTTASCGDTSTEALAANTGRVSALLVNDSTQTIWIKINEAAVTNQGIRLNANGGSYYITHGGGDGNLDSEVVNCIVASGTGTILATEWSN